MKVRASGFRFDFSHEQDQSGKLPTEIKILAAETCSA